MWRLALFSHIILAVVKLTAAGEYHIMILSILLSHHITILTLCWTKVFVRAVRSLVGKKTEVNKQFKNYFFSKFFQMPSLSEIKHKRCHVRDN